MFESYTSTYDHPRLTSNEIAMRAHAQEHKLAQLVAGYRNANRKPATNSNPLRRILTLLSNL